MAVEQGPIYGPEFRIPNTDSRWQSEVEEGPIRRCEHRIPCFEFRLSNSDSRIQNSPSLPGRRRLLNGQALARPVLAEIMRNVEHAQVREAHPFEGRECRTDVGTFVERTATAVDHDVAVVR